MTKNSVVIDADHPAMPGHFPGHPLVPGVIIIEEVIAALKKVYPDKVCEGIKKMKFIAPLEPGTEFEIEFGEPSETSVRFSVATGETRLANGRLALHANT